MPVDHVAGALVLRCTGMPGRGEPLWRRAHPGRQAELMLALACRVCGKPADRSSEGVLWLLPLPRMRSGRHRRVAPGWPEGARVEHPPVCAEHALASPGLCPALGGAVLVRASMTALWGVAGWRLLPGTEPVHGCFAFGDARALRWVAATHLLRTLTGCTVLTLEDLRAGLTGRSAVSGAAR
ncbi:MULTISPECIES: hypothetical protein [unclassified Kitasatospora]|uniref:hypothetical protein n=1 Tax=unclassified Kitasatospora TaxID=2633591 RepID=UPI00381ACBFE